MAGLDLAQQLENTTSALANALSFLPSQISTAYNTSILANELVTLSQSLAPILEALSPVFMESLLTNLTFVKDNIGSLGAALSKLPRAEVERSSSDELVQLVAIGSTKFSLGTVWAPEVWAILFVFVYATLTKLSLWALVPRNIPPVERPLSEYLFEAETSATISVKREKKAQLSMALEKKARLIFRHAFSIIVSTWVLILQIIAYRAFAVPSTALNLQDFKLLSGAAKLVILPYGLELVYNQPHNHLWAHHLFTFLLIFIGQFTADETKDVLFFRLLQWWILQASTEQPTYLAMISYHTSEYLKLRHLHPRFQQWLLVLAARSMTFTSWITYPQKFIPIGFATYWIARMWAEEDTYSPFGRFWLAWCVVLLMLLVLMQVWFCEETFAMAAHFYAKAKGEIPLPRGGPLSTFFKSRLYHWSRPRTACGGVSTTFRSKEHVTLLQSATPFQWPPGREDISHEWSSTLTLDDMHKDAVNIAMGPSEFSSWDFD